MTTALLRVPRQPPVPVDAGFYLVGAPAAFVGGDNVKSACQYNGVTYVGFVDGDGSARVASYNHASRAVVVSPAIVTGLTPDIHASPSVLVRSSDHKLLVAVAPHDAAHMYVAISSSAEDVSAWSAATDIASTLAGTTYTYAHLVQLSGESGKIYLFFRDRQTGPTNVLAYSTSTDGGSTWSAETALYKNANKQSYWAIATDSVSRIDFAVSDGAASVGDSASLYHFYYSGSARYKSDGTSITASLPLGPTDITKIYDGATNGSVRIPYSIPPGGATVAWASYDPAGSGQPELYWYGTYSGGWTFNEIDSSGSVPDTNFSEGGLAIDPLDSSVVYVSRKDSAGYWQIFRYETSDSGATWTFRPLTSNQDGSAASVLNLRPIAPRDALANLRCLWCFGAHFVIGTLETFSSQIRGYSGQ